MDFSGHDGGRVVNDPNEALGVAIDEAYNWRKKAPVMLPPQHVEERTSTWCGATLHRAQPWYQGAVSREKTAAMIEASGMVDG